VDADAPNIRPTVRSLAKQLRLSRTTVSDALRDHPRVNAVTRERVRVAAKEAGYRFNPLASSILSEVRRMRVSTFRGVLAAVSLEEPGRAEFKGPFWRRLLRGAKDRAEELGFSVEHFVVGDRGISIQRLDTILRSRGIRGVLIMPTWRPPDFTQLKWDNYAGVYADYLIDMPGLNSVCPDHPRAMVTAMTRLLEYGFRRPGLVLLEQESHRIQDRWIASFLAFEQFHEQIASLPPLILPSMDAEPFTKWFRKYKPDVVLGHRAELMTWMTAAGARVPETHGFCCLNVDINAEPCAGIDQHPYYVGVRCVEQVTAQILHNSYGIPELPCNTTVPAKWVDGPTVMARVVRSE
jgi:DNA-binding LacI/PurR family transcriptional regulator